MSIQEIRDYQLKKLEAYNRPWLTVAECARVLDISDSAARTAVEFGELDGIQHKRGGRIMITKTSIRNYILCMENPLARIDVS